MNKQEAIQFIQQQLDQERSTAEIVDALAQYLGAPRPMVEKFVAQTEAEYVRVKPVAPPPPVESQLPPWLQGDTVTAPYFEPPAKATPFVENSYAGSDYSSPVVAAATAIPAMAASEAETPTFRDTGEVADYVIAQYRNGRTETEIVSDVTGLTHEPRDLVEKFVALTLSKYNRENAAPQQEMLTGRQEMDSKEKALMEDPVIVKYIFSELTKGRKKSDLAVMLTERVGLPYANALRLVSQIATENHAKINARKNVYVIPVCIIFIVLGFVGVIYGATSLLLDYGPLVGLNFTAPQQLSRMSINYALGVNGFLGYIFLFLGGFGAIAGALVGIYYAVRSQMS